MTLFSDIRYIEKYIFGSAGNFVLTNQLLNWSSDALTDFAGLTLKDHCKKGNFLSRSLKFVQFSLYFHFLYWRIILSDWTGNHKTVFQARILKLTLKKISYQDIRSVFVNFLTFQWSYMCENAFFKLIKKCKSHLDIIISEHKEIFLASNCNSHSKKNLLGHCLSILFNFAVFLRCYLFENIYIWFSRKFPIEKHLYI